MRDINREKLVEEIRIQANSVALLTHDPSTEGSDVAPEPQSLNDLSSFGVMQLMLQLEERYDILIMEDLVNFTSTGFDDLAEFLAQHIEQEQKEKTR